MHAGPPKIAEAIVSILVPPACREEVVGDLHERFESPLQYAIDALHTVPLIVVSRIRRTADPQVLLIQAVAFYMSFLGVAWFEDVMFLRGRWCFLRLAIPAAMAVAGLVLDDAYAKPGRWSALNVARGPLLGIVLALASQELLRLGNVDLAIPRWILFYGCATILLLSSAIRILFPPITGQFVGVNAPAAWLKREAKLDGTSTVVLILLLLLLLAYQIYRPV